MFRGSTPPEQKTYKRTYERFAGVDLTSAMTDVADQRSPNAPNMIADLDGFPKKRVGYTTIKNYGDRINGLHVFVTKDGTKKMLVHSGNRLYDGDKLIYSNMANARSVSFVYGGNVYFLDGKTYLCWDGTSSTAVPVTQNAYVPTTAISMKPTGGGTDFEPVNLLQSNRINSYLVEESDASATVFQLDTVAITSVVKCEKRNSSGVWGVITGYTVDTANGKVTFVSAPGKTPVVGEDNVRITFQKVVSDYAERINNCKIRTFYGLGNDTRIFVSGNESLRNYDWVSWSGRADYFPDNQYSIIGSETSAIVGYLKQYSELLIVKETNDQDATVFLRSAQLGEDNKSVFLTEQGLAGEGAISPYCFQTLYDDNVFLSKGGLFGFDTQSITRQKTVQLRSYFVNAKLTKEPDLQEAVSLIKDGYLYIFINGRVYVADGRQRSDNFADSFGYEWYYFTDMPARCVCEYDNVIYMGGTDGSLRKMKSEEVDGMQAYSDDGAAIYACWSTKMDDLGDPSQIKRIMKNGTGVLVMPFATSGGKIYYVTDNQEFVKGYSLSLVFDFDNIDFNNIDFGETDYPVFVPCRKKKRKAKMLQMVVENGEVNQAFGLYAIMVEYMPTKPIKRQ